MLTRARLRSRRAIRRNYSNKAASKRTHKYTHTHARTTIRRSRMCLYSHRTRTAGKFMSLRVVQPFLMAQLLRRRRLCDCVCAYV